MYKLYKPLDKYIPNACNAMLIIFVEEIINVIMYTVHIVNCTGITMKSQFYLAVAPEILSEIVDSIGEGSDLATFTCQATGKPVPTISWYFNDVMINESDANKYMIISTSLNTTTTENTLTVYNVTSSDVGTYTCNATNTIGSDISHGESAIMYLPEILLNHTIYLFLKAS